MDNTNSLTHSQSALPFLVLGIIILLFDGYDLFVFGSVAPVLLEYEAWNVPPALIGLIASLPPLAAPVGAIVAGYAADVFGRRLPMIVSLTWASACMFGTFVAPTLSIFMATRLAAGLGLGALVPLTLAIVVYRAPAHRVTLYTCAALTGIAGAGQDQQAGSSSLAMGGLRGSSKRQPRRLTRPRLLRRDQGETRRKPSSPLRSPQDDSAGTPHLTGVGRGGYERAGDEWCLRAMPERPFS